MKSNNLLWFGLGIAIGYVFMKKNWGNKIVRPIADTALQAGTDLAMDVKDTVVDTAKLTKCEAEWVKFSSTARFASQEGAEQAKKDFMAKCMAK
jgi:hypothetical protein